LNSKDVIYFPIRSLKRLIKSFIIEINEFRYPEKKRYQDLIKMYKKCELSHLRNENIKYLNNILKSLGFKNYNELEGLYSEHLIIFSAIARSKYKIKNILEIGTHNGKTTSILSRLFPNAHITTIDLDDDDETFKGTYKRDKNLKLFIKNRNKLLSKHNNINFIQFNSLNLTISNKNIPKQDLIWVDGAHGYPVVSSDITNAIRLMHKSTILMCDDIWKRTKKNDQMYVSKAGYETISCFSNAKIIKTNFFRKRIGKSFNGNYKFISFSKLIKDKP
tara:strand:+ start:3349 stop:4176 length:828 start_codon:yes stop_codon:yes gene_type:complete